MKRALIVGAGNLGRELASWAPGCLGYGVDWTVGGFLNDDLRVLDGFHVPETILGTIRDYQPQDNDVLVMAISDPRGKLTVAEMLKQRGAQFLTLQHHTTLLGRDVTQGEGCVFCPYSVASCGAKLGNFITVNLHCTLGHDSVMGDGCTLSSHCDTTGHVVLGRGVFMGSHASVLPKVKVGDFAKIAAGSTVMRDAAAGTTIIGVPGKRLPLPGTAD